VDGLGRAYILPYGNKNSRTGEKDATFIIGYKGIIDLARRSGAIKSLHAQAVYEGDEFESWEDESGQHFKFRQDRNAEHSEQKLTDVFVNAQLMTGGFVFEHMTRAEIDKIRGRSKASHNGPWVSDYEAMAKKTVIRRVFPVSPCVRERGTGGRAQTRPLPDYADVFHPVIDANKTPQIEAAQQVTPDEEAAS
jgi:recombination protein RecT